MQKLPMAAHCGSKPAMIKRRMQTGQSVLPCETPTNSFMTYHAIDFDRYPISPVLCFFFFFPSWENYSTYYSTPWSTLNGRQKYLFWELVFDLMIRSDEQQTSAFWMSLHFLCVMGFVPCSTHFSWTVIQLLQLEFEPDDSTSFRFYSLKQN